MTPLEIQESVHEQSARLTEVALEGLREEERGQLMELLVKVRENLEREGS